MPEINNEAEKTYSTGKQPSPPNQLPLRRNTNC